jgi:hypothetical protein
MSYNGGAHANISCPFKTKSNVPRHVLQNDTASDINKCLIPVSVEVGTLVGSVESKSEGWSPVFRGFLNQTQVVKPTLLGKVREAE